MRVIGQGLRRSGTSIFFRLISQDSRFVTYSEPLAKDKILLGSANEKGKDHMKDSRLAREDFLQSRGLNSLQFNHGAPTNFEIELIENSLDNDLLDYISFLLERGDNTFLKFVRCGFSVEQLSKIDNNLLYIHLEKSCLVGNVSYFRTTLHRIGKIGGLVL